MAGEGGHLNRAGISALLLPGCVASTAWPPPRGQLLSRLRVSLWRMKVRGCAASVGALGSCSYYSEARGIAAGLHGHRHPLQLGWRARSPFPPSHIRDAAVTAPAAVEIRVFWLPNISDHQNPRSWGWDVFTPRDVNAG